MHVTEFYLNPSRQYLIIFSAIVLASVLILCSLPMVLWLKLVCIVVVVLHGSRVGWRYALLRDRLSITAIKQLAEGRWLVQNKEGAFVGELHPSSTVTTWVMLLHFKVAGKMLPLKSVIFRDSLLTDHFRQLLILLKM